MRKPALRATAAAALEETAPASLPQAAAEPALQPAPGVPLVEHVAAEMTRQTPAGVSETASQVQAASALQSAEDARDTMTASPAAEELLAPQYATVMGSRIEPVTLALASTKLSPLKARQSAVAGLRTRIPKIPLLSRAPLRLKVVKEARAVIPSVRAFDDPKAASPAIAAPSVPEPLMLVVSLDAQKLDIYRGITHVASAKISSGMPGYRHEDGRVQHPREEAAASLKSLQRRADAVHAAAHTLRHGAPCRLDPGLSRLAWLRAAALLLRAQAVRDDVGRPDCGGDAIKARAEARIEHPNLFQLPSPNPQMAMAADTAASEHRLSDAVDVATTRTNEDQDHEAAFRSDAPLRMLVTRRTAHDRVIAVQYLLADMGYLPRQNFSGAIGTATRNAIRVFQSAHGLPETGAFTDELVRQVYGAAGKIEPPEGHLYVRQDFSRVFDVAVAFRDPAVSLGTHVFTVVKRADPEAKPEWMVVSLEGGDAASVLDRIDIPDGVRRSIAPRLKPGSTLIIADKSEYSAILPEGDDFLVSTAEQAKAEDAKVEQASAGPGEVAPVRAKLAKPRTVRATPAARPRANASYQRETRRRTISRPSPFGMPYLFGR